MSSYVLKYAHTLKHTCTLTGTCRHVHPHMHIHVPANAHTHLHLHLHTHTQWEGTACATGYHLSQYMRSLL